MSFSRVLFEAVLESCEANIVAAICSHTFSNRAVGAIFTAEYVENVRTRTYTRVSRMARRFSRSPYNSKRFVNVTFLSVYIISMKMYTYIHPENETLLQMSMFEWTYPGIVESTRREMITRYERVRVFSTA